MKHFAGTRTICLLVICVSMAQSQSPSTNFPRFTMTAGKADEDGFPVSGASLCVFGHKDICYQMPSHTTAPPSPVTYDFGLEPQSERLTLSDGGSWVFFSSEFSAGGSGTLDRLAVLRYEPSGTGRKIVNLLPYVGVTNSSDRAMWSLPQLTPYPILVIADFIWGKNETHFSPHFYEVEAWTFSVKEDKYVHSLSYRTSKRYDSLDTVDRIRVLAPEKEEIMRRLAAARTK